MKVLIIKANDDDYEEIKDINTIEELKELYHKIIIDFNVGKRYKDHYKVDIQARVTIYNDYVE